MRIRLNGESNEEKIAFISRGNSPEDANDTAQRESLAKWPSCAMPGEFGVAFVGTRLVHATDFRLFGEGQKRCCK